MSGGPRYSDDELRQIAVSVALGESCDETIARVREIRPDRPKSSIVKMRADPRTQEMVRSVVEYGVAHYWRHQTGQGAGIPGGAARVKASHDPKTGDLNIMAPRGDHWARPVDLLDRAGIAYELNARGEPVPIHYIMEVQNLNEWSTSMRDSTGEIVAAPNWQCKIRLRKRPGSELLRASADILAGIRDIGPTAPRPTPRLEGCLLELVLPDLHFGKLAHHEEVGEDLDSKIAQDRALEAAHSIISRAQHYDIASSVYVVGNDLLNADGEAGATTAGTRQDQDSRWHKTLRIAVQTERMVIDMLRELGPVRVVVVPGNHDRESAIAVGSILEAYYHACGDVEVDSSPNPRKYMRHGDVLLGWTHGDGVKAPDLPLIMADECPEWSDTRIREWHLGHLHKAKSIHHLTLDETRGVRVRHLSALTGIDAWHHAMGYRSLIQADGFVWHPTKGLRANIVEQP